jgi:hypothetical protein
MRQGMNIDNDPTDGTTPLGMAYYEFWKVYKKYN